MISATINLLVKDNNDNPNLNGGPIEGFDISVYKVKTNFILGTPPSKLYFDPTDPAFKPTVENFYNNFENYVWPACFPRHDEDDHASNRGFIAGWLDLPPQIVRDPLQIGIESFSYQGVK